MLSVNPARLVKRPVSSSKTGSFASSPRHGPYSAIGCRARVSPHLRGRLISFLQTGQWWRSRRPHISELHPRAFRESTAPSYSRRGFTYSKSPSVANTNHRRRVWRYFEIIFPVNSSIFHGVWCSLEILKAQSVQSHGLSVRYPSGTKI